MLPPLGHATPLQEPYSKGQKKPTIALSKQLLLAVDPTCCRDSPLCKTRYCVQTARSRGCTDDQIAESFSIETGLARKKGRLHATPEDILTNLSATEQAAAPEQAPASGEQPAAAPASGEQVAAAPASGEQVAAAPAPEEQVAAAPAPEEQCCACCIM